MMTHDCATRRTVPAELIVSAYETLRDQALRRTFLSSRLDCDLLIGQGMAAWMKSFALSGQSAPDPSRPLEFNGAMPTEEIHSQVVMIITNMVLHHGHKEAIS